MIIASRYNGPPDSGNGGYSAGLLAAYLDPETSVTVTLRRPPPLDVELAVRPAPRGVAAYDGERLIADAIPAAPGAAVAPASLDEARAAEARYAGFVDHPFPTCYACGPDRTDGLRIFAGPLGNGDGRTAGVFRVPDDARPETVWAALDCPGGWTIVADQSGSARLTPRGDPDRSAPGRRYVLGRITALVDTVPKTGEECVVVGECTGIEGRKASVRTTVYGPDGGALARASATWIAI